MTEENNVRANEAQATDRGERFVWKEGDVEITEPEVEMAQAEDETSKPVHHQTKRGADLAISRKEISQESHKAVLAGRITLAEAKELGRNAGPDGPVGQSTKKASTSKKDKPITLCLACGEPTLSGSRFHQGCDMKMHRIADEHLRGERDLTNEQREYLETSGKMEQARKKAAKNKK